MADLELTPLDEAEPKPPVNLLGGQTPQQELASRDAMAELDESTSFVKDALPAAFQQNLGPQLWKTLDSKFSNAPEEGFDPQAWLAENPEQVPADMHDKFSGVRSTAEAVELRDRINDDIQNTQILQAKGARGIAATLLAGMVDVDAPLALVTGGTAKAATLGGRVMRGAASGAATGAAIEAGHVIVDPLAETSDIINGALFGTVLGGAAGAVFNRSVAGVRDEFNEAAPHLEAIEYDEYFQNADNQFSVGAAYQGNAVDPTSEMDEAQKAVFRGAQDTMRKPADIDGFGVGDLLTDMRGAEGHTAAAGRKLAETIQKVPGLRSLYDDVALMPSTIAKAITYDLLESPAGRARNNRSAAGYENFYRGRLGTEFVPATEAYETWAKANSIPTWDRHSGKARDQFDRAVFRELDDRAHGVEPEARSQDDHVVAAADALDRYAAEDRRQHNGLESETATDGAANLTDRPGYYPREWDGSSMRRLLRDGVDRGRIERMIASAYVKVHPTLKADGHDMVVAKAIVRRALSNEDGIDSGMLMSMDQDARGFLRELLTDSNVDTKTVDQLMSAVTGKAEERGKAASNKSRIDLDMRVQDGDLSMYDLINTNATQLYEKRTRRTAGAAALARKGITNKAQQKVMIEAAINEMTARGEVDTKKHRETLENMFTYFNGGLIQGGVNPWIVRMRSLTSLGVLNQMGITQAGETGQQMAAVGMDVWKHHAKELLTDLENKPKLLQELEVLGGRIGQDHNLHRAEYALADEMRNHTGTIFELNKFIDGLDFALGKGRRLQGFISGFYAIKGTQQKIATTSMASKVMQSIRDDTHALQMQDIGINPKQFKKYLKGVTWNEKGFVDDLGTDKWDAQDAQDFSMAINRHSRQVVQEPMIGESSVWWSTDMGAFFSYLKTFPLLAMQKQAARNMNMGAPMATAALAMGLATAGTVYAAKSVVNGHGVPTPADMAGGAFSMSNMTGWFPMLADPVSAMLGMDALRFNKYGRASVSEGVLPTPAMIPILNRQAHIPLGVLNPVNQMSRNDRIRALQAAPIVGNMVGMTAIWNAMKN